MIIIKPDNPADKRTIIDLSYPIKKNNMAISFQSVTHCYNSSNILENVSGGISTTDRIVIVGKNGAGKSTLMKIISGKLCPSNKDSLVNIKVPISYYSQSIIDQLDCEMNPVEFIMSKYNITYEETKKELGKIGVKKDLMNKKIFNLSGGYKARIALLLLIIDYFLHALLIFYILFVLIHMFFLF